MIPATEKIMSDLTLRQQPHVLHRYEHKSHNLFFFVIYHVALNQHYQDVSKELFAKV